MTNFNEIIHLNAELEQLMEGMFDYLDAIGLENWESEINEQLGKTTSWLGNNLICLMSSIILLKRAEKFIQLNELENGNEK